MKETFDPTPTARRAGDDPSLHEARFAHRVVARLDDAAAALSPDVEERLRFARAQAMARARVRQRTAAGGTLRVGAGVAARRGGPAWWQRTGGWVAVVLVVAGLWAIGQYQTQRRVQSAVEIDARLLTDVLPPAAYADPGFEAFLAQGASR
jgi:hypothetical protein